MRQTVRRSTSESGFTLVEVAIVIAIVGLILGAYFAFLTPMTQQRNQQITEQRMQKIANALSDFAQRNGRMPCAAPIVPGGNPLGTAFNLCNPANSEGIVPFRDLGLTRQDATDGWGSAFTYRVQRVVGAEAHLNMRLDNSWMNITGVPPVNMNPRKAMFCGCSAILPQIVVNEVTPPVAAPQPVVPAQAITAGTMAPPDTPAGPTPNGDQLRYIAYVLISHGPNREQAFLWGQAGRSLPVNAQPSDIENANGDFNFIIRPRSDTPGAEFYDDTILWRTQFDVMRELGNDSCARA